MEDEDEEYFAVLKTLVEELLHNAYENESFHRDGELYLCDPMEVTGDMIACVENMDEYDVDDVLPIVRDWMVENLGYGAERTS